MFHIFTFSLRANKKKQQLVQMDICFRLLWLNLKAQALSAPEQENDHNIHVSVELDGCNTKLKEKQQGLQKFHVITGFPQ